MIIDTNQPSEVLTAQLTKWNTSEDHCMAKGNRINRVKPNETNMKNETGGYWSNFDMIHVVAFSRAYYYLHCKCSTVFYQVRSGVARYIHLVIPNNTTTNFRFEDHSEAKTRLDNLKRSSFQLHGFLPLRCTHVCTS